MLVRVSLEYELSPLCIVEITESEVIASLKALKPDKAIGLDDIAPLFLMIPGEEVKSDSFTLVLTQLFNLIFESGDFPDEWKIDRRLPFFKAGSKLDVKKYRLLAIHSVFRKLFNKILERRIRSSLALDEAQAGFRPERRATDHAFVLHDIICERSHSKTKATPNRSVSASSWPRASNRGINEGAEAILPRGKSLGFACCVG